MADVTGRIDGWWNDSTEKWFTVRCPELRSSTSLAITRCEKHCTSQVWL